MSDLRISLLACLVGCLLAFSLSGCDGTSAAGTPEVPEFLQEETQDSTGIPLERIAISVWPEVGLRVEPGRNLYTKDKQKNYITTIQYGEKVELLGEQDTLQGSDNRKRVYIKVRLQDGKEGWVDDFLFERDCRIAVMKEDAEVYRRPDLMTLRDKKLRAGEIVVVMEPKDGFLHISNEKKATKGWTPIKNNLSFEMKDIKGALLYMKAMNDPTVAGRSEKLQNILDDASLKDASVTPLVEKELHRLRTEVAPAQSNRSKPIAPPDTTEKLVITHPEARLMREPRQEDSGVLLDLEEGQECLVLSKGSAESIDDRLDFWYKIKLQGREGWVFGYYTSMRAPQ